MNVTARDYWHKQDPAQPLYPDMLWSRPENKRQAGKLVIVGGNLYSFAAPAGAYQTAVQAGIGTVKVLLPDALKTTLGRHFEAAEFGPSTPSGSFSQAALAEFLDLSAWADAVLLAGDLGRNSETAILVEKFLQKYSGPLVLTKDAVDYTYNLASLTLSRPGTCLVLSLAQLQRLTKAANTSAAVTFAMDLLQLVDFLHDFTLKHQVYLITRHLDTVFVAVDGQVSTTKLKHEQSIWRVETAGKAAVWWLQNPFRPEAALASSLISIA